MEKSCHIPQHPLAEQVRLLDSLVAQNLQRGLYSDAAQLSLEWDRIAAIIREETGVQTYHI